MPAAIPTIVFIHLGAAPLPRCALDAMRNTRRLSPSSRIVLIAAAGHADLVAGQSAGVDFVAAEPLLGSEALQRFQANSSLKFEFRNDFWFHTSARFIVLAEYMRSSGAVDVIHLENDVSLHFDPALKLEAFRRHAEFAVPLDRTRAIAGIVWCANANAANRLSEHMLAQPLANDMESIGAFCSQNPNYAKPLPTIPASYVAAKGLDTARYAQGLEAFGGVFDAAAIGQFIGGVDRRNNPHDSRFFINESSDLDLREFELAWQVEEGVRLLTLGHAGARVPVLSIHAHSKDIAGISPFNHGVVADPEDVLTGERLQALADLTVGSATITRFHGRANIESADLVEIPQNEAGQLLVPNEAIIEKCRGARVIFIYTHLLLYFKRYIAPRLDSPFTLICHNSDNGVGLDDLDLLNHAYLDRCWAQHAETAHSRLTALPSGMANRQWGDTRITQIAETARHIVKDKLLYANVNPTHPSRVHAMAMAAKVPGGTVETNVSFEHFISELVRHKFCLCPRGNGIDSHRFWESLYLDCIPVIIRPDWISAYSEFPVLLLNSWDELPMVDWQQAYLRIKSTAHRFTGLSLRHVAQQITGTPDQK